ncbi:coat F domain-containing protein [Cytobacillus oceanisediminis]|uniref:Coat F domain-containing protein n=1 Tax=Cytobacillus oceanisediminis TaxID=665099 RepID=A0A2V2ZZQ8_9BACI|nr:spore coat protein [Cytobacillus oceanisediminis]PWW29628.1 coat F domain-containing protein [Cytobacillus oceanisediminis]
MNQNQNQNQNTIQNPETQVNSTPQMNDRDFANDLLSTEKYMTNAYSVAMNEARHQSLYQDMLTVFNETQNQQRELYNLMFKKGWYKVEAADQQKLQQSYQQFQGYSNQFPYGNSQMQ